MLNVTVKTAVELTSAQLGKISKAIEKKYGKQVSLEEVVDPRIVGGIQLIIGSRLIDGSVKGKIQQLYQALKKS